MPRIAAVTYILLLLISLIGSVHANPAANPFNILLEHARKGNADAMFEVGKHYASGEYTAQNWRESLYWYQQAVQKNHARAMLYLGRILLQGVEEAEVPADVPRALQLIEQAASAGDAEAQFQLGQIFAQGEVIGQDLPSAIRWYRAANQQGYPHAGQAMRRSIELFKNRFAH
ncbi:MAG: tetratricopeptide repeat protein [Gammaproteobacteria bacterium]